MKNQNVILLEGSLDGDQVFTIHIAYWSDDGEQAVNRAILTVIWSNSISSIDNPATHKLRMQLEFIPINPRDESGAEFYNLIGLHHQCTQWTCYHG